MVKALGRVTHHHDTLLLVCRKTGNRLNNIEVSKGTIIRSKDSVSDLKFLDVDLVLIGYDLGSMCHAGNTIGIDETQDISLGIKSARDHWLILSREISIDPEHVVPLAKGCSIWFGKVPCFCSKSAIASDFRSARSDRPMARLRLIPQSRKQPQHFGTRCLIKAVQGVFARMKRL